MGRTEIETYCQEKGFLFHERGSGKWGSERYWTYYKVEKNDRTLFSIEYFPVGNRVDIRCLNNRFQGVPESLEHLHELLAALRIEL